MPSKLALYTELADRQARQITGSREDWTSFLDTAGRLYKYPFEEQLMIYSQRPDATACAPLEMWNKPMNRFVRRGSKGIALIDETGEKPRLKYVFDVADTIDGRYNAKKPYVWELKPEHDRAVIEAIDRAYNIDSFMGWDSINGRAMIGNGVGDVIFGLAHELAARYYGDHEDDIFISTENTYLSDYEPDDVRIAFQSALTVSAAYCIMARCGIDASEHLDDEDFLPIFDFNTTESVTALGRAVSGISEEVLRNIEVTIKNYERQHTAESERSESYERTDVHPAGGLSDPGYSDRGNAGIEQVRDDEEELPPRTPPDPVLDHEPETDVVSPLPGDRTGGDREARPDNVRITEAELAARQGGRPDGLGGTHEQPESPGRGINPRGTDLQLNAEQQEAQYETPSEQGGVSAFQTAIIVQEDIDNALIAWNGDPASANRVYEYMREHARAREAAGFLQNEYGQTDFVVNKDGAEPIALPWVKVQRRVAQLMDAGHFVAVDEPVITAAPVIAGEPAVEAEPVTVGEPVTATEPEPLTAALPPEPEADTSPKPVFLRDKNDIHSMDLSQYNDGDIVGYDKNGVEYGVTRMGEHTFISSTTRITPMGDIIGMTDIPADILRQIRIANGLESPKTEQETVYERFISTKEQYPDHIVMVKLGDFFELHGDDAQFMADNFGYTVVTRRIDGQDIPLVGVPDHIAASVIKLINNTGRDVALVDSDGAMTEYQKTELTAEQPEQSEYVLSYRYANDRLIVFNDIDPDEISIVARVEPDGSIVILDEKLPEAERLEITRVTETELDRYRGEAEARWQDMLDIAAAQTGGDRQQSVPENPQMNLFNFPVAESVQPEQTRTAPPIPEKAQEPHGRVNFHIDDPGAGAYGRRGFSPKTAFRANMDAINALHNIEFENRLATPEEQQTLSRYVGWGGVPQAFDPDNKQWENEYLELKAALSPADYDMARASTLNAHYTSPTVIRAMYETLERLGFKDGNLLEPACGVGNFFGLLPDSMSGARLYGVELDSVTGRIAKQLYQKADIKVMGFEKTNTPDAFFDAAIGNVPFGSYKVNDRRYEKQNFLIHDFFFAKTLDQVRPGGVVAFITSKGTLDKANPEVRKYIAQRAELLGAVRLPNNAFLKNAGTEVTSDIIFLQKRDRLIDIEPDWVHLGLNDNGISVNSYFSDNPEMILGTMAYDSSMYGGEKETTCNPIEGVDLSEQLREALSHIQGQITEVELDDIEGIQDTSIPADSNVRNFSYALVTPAAPDEHGNVYAGKIGEGTVYYRENSRMYPVDMPAATLERVKGMIGLRDCARELIDYQLYDHPDSDIKAKQAELNTLYDSFTRKFGLVSDSANNRAFSADSAYYLLCSLEILDENGKLERKSDMFTKRTIKQHVEITHVDTASEALALSIANKARVDMGYMEFLTGKDRDTLIKDLDGVVFLNIGFASDQSKTYVTADEYLSGNVREKLAQARAAQTAFPDGRYDTNVKALESVQPKDLDASEISVRLGATWIDPSYIEQFTRELLQPSRYMRDDLTVRYSQYSGEWHIDGKNRVSYSDVLANVTYGTSRMDAYEILEQTLNLKDVRIYDIKHVNGGEQRIINQKETALAQQKQGEIKQAFKDWIFRDPERRQTLVALYNERFNSTRPREYDGSHIQFVGMSPEIKFMQHQKDAVAHTLYGSGNSLFAHEVGAGKTFEMIASAMEGKRLGLCHKSIVTVPNHLTEQWAAEFLRLYPSANILVARQKDFETANRKKFCAKIATGDYDAVIIGHSQFERIPLSQERQKRLLDEQIDDITNGIAELKDEKGDRFSIKQMERTKKNLEFKLVKLLDGKRKDNVVTFEELGVDRLFVDESQNFKNLFLYTKMLNVAGLSTSDAQKSSDMFMKCRYMDETQKGRGVIFATGTPVTNSMTEMYTLQRYLQYDRLEEMGLTHFDAWASTFGDTQTSIELAPEGNGYRARTRFAKFDNLPELMSMVKDFADIKTADMLDLPRPEAHFINIKAEPSELQKAMVQDLSARAKAVHDKKVKPEQDNMLKITTDGRKIGLDQRLMNPLLPDDPGSKVNQCTDNIYDIWEKTADKRLTQLLFCDFSTPNADGRFNVYDDIKEKLIAKGIPADEIAFIHDANTEKQKKELFAKVRQGKVRVLCGSTFKMGAGTNVQDRLVAIHDLDCPWRPADLAQRAGRIVRQGNQNPEVFIYRYVTEGTFDSYLFQTLEKKQTFISQIMTSKSPVRSCDDIDADAMSYAEIKALCAGNPLIKEKMQLDIEVAQLRMLKGAYQSQQYRLQDDLLIRFPKAIESGKESIEGFKRDMERLETGTHKGEEGISPMTIGNKTYTDRGEAGAALLEARKSITSEKPVKVGSYRGFDMFLSYHTMTKEIQVDMKGAMTHSATLGDDGGGNITRINNAFDKIPQRLMSVEAQLQTVAEQMDNARIELEKPFPQEAALAEKSARLAELDTQLSLDSQPTAAVPAVEEAAKAEPLSAKEKPSILETLKINAEKSRQMFGGKAEPAEKPAKECL